MAPSFTGLFQNLSFRGGASDNTRIMRKRRELGRYLIPVDAAPSDRHHRGVISPCQVVKLTILTNWLPL